ncbi:MAG TPA: class I SAM-dependent methyltransferase [Gemmatimonadaceae bacterium]|nr:class I SAM-dependent methyltransferase [Gemmatimonadaceae bacterium]
MSPEPSPQDPRPSQTTAGVAWLRAAHQLLDDPPLILADPAIVRQPEWARSIRIIEVDRPETQMARRARLEAAALTIPENVTFAGVDFESETLAHALRRHGVQTDEPVFFPAPRCATIVRAVNDAPRPRGDLLSETP